MTAQLILAFLLIVFTRHGDCGHTPTATQRADPSAEDLDSPTSDMLDNIAGWGFPRYTLDYLNEAEDLIMLSADMASSFTSPQLSDCDSEVVTIVVEIAEYMDYFFSDVSEPRPFAVRFDVYRIQSGDLQDSTSYQLYQDSQLQAEVHAGTATLVFSGHHFGEPPKLCLEASSSYALRVHAMQYSSDESEAPQLLDSFAYVLGPCAPGCFRPRFSLLRARERLRAQFPRQLAL
ncbi:hypothetical protein CYMTET_32852 [Cymbomonas tetramitiformis]|uniref:Uncharacterized protein n=1 Tax=Cymbomonas tetramitiformis TaxID=36881 RepID=A0AAE0FEL3_9CHLO|nr:hypothetical protein CYMTET_32852 [Cymbomonas tetramitiformis]